MSKVPGRRQKAEFVACPGDPVRPGPLKDGEYAALVAGLGTRVVPVLEATAETLRQKSQASVRVERKAGMVSLLACWERCPIEAKLRFQIHETFAVLTTRDPVFWMSVVYCGTELITGRPGRFAGLDDPAVLSEIVDGFVEDCLAAWRSGISRQAVQSPAIFRAALTRELRIRPREGCRGWTRYVPGHPLPSGLADRELVEVIASKWSRVHVRDSADAIWELSHWQVDCGSQYVAPDGRRLPESHPSILAAIRDATWDAIAARGSVKDRRSNAARILQLIWVLQRNGADVAEFNESLVDLDIR